MLRKAGIFALLTLFVCKAWALQDNQQTLLAKLTGESPITGETVLTNRYSQENREMAASYLLKQIEQVCDEASIDSYSETGKNVIGIIRATSDTDEWILLGAHYDSVRDSPGANDNASGTSLVYEVAKSIAALESRKYNVYIVFFDEEERGLIGSRDIAKKLKEEGVNLLSAHTIDQMGWDEDGDRGIELEKPTEALKAHYLQVAKDHGLTFPIHTTNVTSTDHRAFRELGFDAMGLTEEYKNKDTTPHYHKATDDFSTINLEYLAEITSYMQKVFEALLTN